MGYCKLEYWNTKYSPIENGKINAINSIKAFAKTVPYFKQGNIKYDSITSKSYEVYSGVINFKSLYLQSDEIRRIDRRIDELETVSSEIFNFVNDSSKHDTQVNKIGNTFSIAKKLKQYQTFYRTNCPPENFSNSGDVLLDALFIPNSDVFCFKPVVSTAPYAYCNIQAYQNNQVIRYDKLRSFLDDSLEHYYHTTYPINATQTVSYSGMHSKCTNIFGEGYSYQIKEYSINQDFENYIAPNIYGIVNFFKDNNITNETISNMNIEQFKKLLLDIHEHINTVAIPYYRNRINIKKEILLNTYGDDEDGKKFKTSLIYGGIIESFFTWEANSSSLNDPRLYKMDLRPCILVSTIGNNIYSNQGEVTRDNFPQLKDSNGMNLSEFTSSPLWADIKSNLKLSTTDAIRFYNAFVFEKVISSTDEYGSTTHNYNLYLKVNTPSIRGCEKTYLFSRMLLMYYNYDYPKKSFWKRFTGIVIGVVLVAVGAVSGNPALVNMGINIIVGTIVSLTINGLTDNRYIQFAATIIVSYYATNGFEGYSNIDYANFALNNVISPLQNIVYQKKLSDMRTGLENKKDSYEKLKDELELMNNEITIIYDKAYKDIYDYMYDDIYKIEPPQPKFGL